MEENYNQEQQRKQWEEFQKYQQQKNKPKKKKGWLWGCGGCLILFVIMIIVFSACSIIFSGTDSSSNKESSNKSYKLGETVKKDGVEVTVTSVEYASTSNEFAEVPKNGKAIKVNFKMKNNNDNQVLFDDTDFTAKVNNKNYEEWYGSGDDHDGFSHQLNKGNTGTGYIYYDVPDTNKYTIEMDATPNYDNIKAKWIINSSDIK